MAKFNRIEEHQVSLQHQIILQIKINEAEVLTGERSLALRASRRHSVC